MGGGQGNKAHYLCKRPTCEYSRLVLLAIIGYNLHINICVPKNNGIKKSRIF